MIHLSKSKDKQFYFTVLSRNGQVLVTSETYKTRRGALNGMASLAVAMRVASDNAVAQGDKAKVAFTDFTKARK